MHRREKNLIRPSAYFYKFSAFRLTQWKNILKAKTAIYVCVCWLSFTFSFLLEVSGCFKRMLEIQFVNKCVKNIIELFINNILQRKTGKDLHISPSTVQNIIKLIKLVFY